MCVFLTDILTNAKYVMFGELVGGAVYSGCQEKDWMGCLLDDLRAFSIKTDQ